MGSVIIDTNLLMLLIVGLADRRYIAMHKNLSDYDEADFELLTYAISTYSDIVLIPHIMAEVSSLARQIKDPARSRIQHKIRDLVEQTIEIPIPSMTGVRRDEFGIFGVTDAGNI